MSEIGSYNTDLHLFSENSKVKIKTLLFHRWIVENQERAFYPSCGEYALALSVRTNLPVEQAINRAFVYASQQELLRRKMADTGDY